MENGFLGGHFSLILFFLPFPFPFSKRERKRGRERERGERKREKERERERKREGGVGRHWTDAQVVRACVTLSEAVGWITTTHIHL